MSFCLAHFAIVIDVLSIGLIVYLIQSNHTHTHKIIEDSYNTNMDHFRMLFRRIERLEKAEEKSERTKKKDK